MTPGKFLVRTLVVVLVMFALGYVGHQLLLGRDYAAIEPIMRSKTDMHALRSALLSDFCRSLRLDLLAGPRRPALAGQGVRFGVAIRAISQVPLYLTNYTIEPWPGMFVANILAWELIASIALGILVAAPARNDGFACERPVMA